MDNCKRLQVQDGAVQGEYPWETERKRDQT
jgi:hypothetical protein